MTSRALAERLIERARQEGVTLAAHHDTLRYRPEDRLREPLKGLLGRHKSEVLTALTTAPPPGYDSITCEFCEGLVWSLTGDGMARCARHASTTDAGDAATFFVAGQSCLACGSNHAWRWGDESGCAECDPPAGFRVPAKGRSASVKSEQ